MTNPSKEDERNVRAGEDGVDPANSLLRMLVVGLVLIVVSMIVVMNFV